MLLTAGACLALVSVAAHVALSGTLTRHGLILNPCRHGCAEGWTVTFAGVVLVTLATGAGLLSPRPLPYAGLVSGLLLAYGASLVWSVYGVQYGLVALIFCLVSFAAGRGAARIIARG